MVREAANGPTLVPVLKRMMVAAGLVALLAGCSSSNDTLRLEVGDCISDQGVAEGGSQSIGELPKVDCEEIHFAEVFYTEDSPSEVFPTSYINGWVDICIEQFEEFVGLEYRLSEYQIATVTPTEETWLEGQRQLVCLLTSTNNVPLIGSARDTGI